MSELGELEVVVVDVQATAAAARGALLEVGWARTRAAAGPDLPEDAVAAHLVAPPAGTELPRAVSRLTGIRAVDWARGVLPERAWSLLSTATSGLAPGGTPAPAVAHFARFEEPHLRWLHARHGCGPFPLDLLCTHAIACRLLPELPRKTLRALAGYFGAGVGALRRSADHVRATAFVWHHVAALLEEREGVRDWAGLRAWLDRPARRCPRRWPLPPERRRALPDRPGVYRFLRAGGAVLYVGKAASLRQRVGSHFHAQRGRAERGLEMLSQARDVSFTETGTALEAALFETDEIKRLSPPYNVALAAAGRCIWFASRDLARTAERPDADHVVGPLVSPESLHGLHALSRACRDPHPAALAQRAAAVGVEAAYAPAPEPFAEGLARFRAERGEAADVRALVRLGARLWTRRLDTCATETEEETEPPPRTWDLQRVALALEETVVRAAHALRRARWLCRLAECSLAFAEAGAASRRLLVIAGGAVAARRELAIGEPLPLPPGHDRGPEARRQLFDVATFDRLRVLTTELRRVAAENEEVELRFGPHARLRGRRLRTVLRWV